jgi:hypothetical protein
MNSDLDDEDTLLDILDSLDWTYEGALDYLNTTPPSGCVWVVRDNSLFLMTEGEADD